MNQCNKKISCNRKRFLLYSKRDLNPHSHHWPKDFKSFVSTDSTIRATFSTGIPKDVSPVNALQRYKIIDNVATKVFFFA